MSNSRSRQRIIKVEGKLLSQKRKTLAFSRRIETFRTYLHNLINNSLGDKYKPTPGLESEKSKVY